MILLVQSSQEYNNDLRVMLMAFYPGVKIIEHNDKDQDIDFELQAEYGTEKTVLRLDGKEIAVEGNYLDKTVFRNKLKAAVYGLLCRKTGHTLPWGDLTGVRPTKIATKQLTEGADFKEAVDNYINVYKVSPLKAQLATRVAVNEMELTRDIDCEGSYCLYVGIPFCPSRCLYCSFTSYPIGRYLDKAVLYIDKLCQELSFIAESYRDKKLVSIYVGGGTPTSISHELLDRLLTHIDNVFNLAGDDNGLLEYTVEAGRPDSITIEKLKVLKQHGVTRISINPQTMNDETLRTIGRAHTSVQTEETFAMAREMGFDNINMDLIAGLPGENLDSMRHTLSRVEALSPESLTVHSLAIKRAANLKQQMETYGSSINQDMDEMHNMAAELSTRLGMEPYYLYRQKNIGGNLENVGYAKKGRECLYNILIMEEMTDIVAAGAGASTKLILENDNHTNKSADGVQHKQRIERIENCKSVDDYIERFEEMLSRKEV